MFKPKFIENDSTAMDSIRRWKEKQRKFKCFFRPKIEVTNFQNKQVESNCFKFNLINNITKLLYNAQQFDGTGDIWKQGKSEPLMRNFPA